MASWSNFTCTINRNATTGAYTVVCGATLYYESWEQNCFVVSSYSRGESAAVAQGNGYRTWTVASGTSFGPVSYSGTWYCRSKNSGGGYDNVGSHGFSASSPAYSYTVTFDDNYTGGGTATETETYGQTWVLPTPTRSGYAFLGWFTEAEGGTEIKATDTVSITADTTLYAHWDAMSILHLVENGEAKTITEIWAVDSGETKKIIGVYAVVNGEVHQGV